MKLPALLAVGALCATIIAAAGPATAQTRAVRAAGATRMTRAESQLILEREPVNARMTVPSPMGPQFTILRAPAFAQIVDIRGSTLMLRTVSGITVGVRIPTAAMQRFNVRTGMRARLIPVNATRLRVQLILNGTAPCMTRIPTNAMPAQVGGTTLPKCPR